MDQLKHNLITPRSWVNVSAKSPEATTAPKCYKKVIGQFLDRVCPHFTCLFHNRCVSWGETGFATRSNISTGQGGMAKFTCKKNRNATRRKARMLLLPKVNLCRGIISVGGGMRIRGLGGCFSQVPSRVRVFN